MSLVPCLAVKASGRRVEVGERKARVAAMCQSWQPPAVFAEALSSVFSAHLQTAFRSLQINTWRVARQRAAENLEAAFSGSFTDTCYELHFLHNSDALQNLASHFQPCTFLLVCILPVLCPVF